MGFRVTLLTIVKNTISDRLLERNCTQNNGEKKISRLPRKHLAVMRCQHKQQTREKHYVENIAWKALRGKYCALLEECLAKKSVLLSEKTFIYLI